MKGLRLLNKGDWTKPPVLTAARSLLFAGLAKHFQKCPLGNSASFLNGTSYDIQQVSELGSSPIIRISNITNPESPYIRTDEDLGDRFWIRRGDLLVSWSASFKSSIWQGPEGFLNQHIFKVSEMQGFLRSYIRHAIEASFDEMQENVVGIGMMHLRRPDFLSYEIPAPPISIQTAVAAYLDWIELDCVGQEPQLPDVLVEQRRIVTRIEELAAQIQEAQDLRKRAQQDVAAFIISVHAQLAGKRTKRLGEVLQLDEDSVPISPAGSYPQVGMRGFGGGLFTKGPVGGTATTYKAFNRLYEGALILSQVKGWEGAVAVCPRELAGWFVSPEYRTFRCIPTEARPGYLSVLVCTEWFWRRLANATRGVGARRERTRPEQFLGIELPMPNTEQQKQGEKLFAEVNALKRLQAETAAELDSILPSILTKAFAGEL